MVKQSVEQSNVSVSVASAADSSSEFHFNPPATLIEHPLTLFELEIKPADVSDAPVYAAAASQDDRLRMVPSAPDKRVSAGWENKMHR